MTTEHSFLQQLTEKLKELNPHKVVLFGSQVYGTQHIDSDIDLLVVTNEEYFPQTYDERFIELNSTFAQEILSRGKILYEEEFQIRSCGWNNTQPGSSNLL